jgi:uncharacterized protein
MRRLDELIAYTRGFEWDRGNSGKNLERHGVSDGECEEVFFNEPLISGQDLRHSQTEQRCYAYGQTDGERLLFLVFTFRSDRIRVISARDMNKNERESYEKAQENTGF